MSRVLLLVCLLALAGCFPGTRSEALSSALDDAGYTGAGISLDRQGDGLALTVSVSSFDGTVTVANAERVAEIVWTDYPGTFDELRVEVDRQPSLTATEAELAERFGPRPPDLMTWDDGPTVTVVVVTSGVAVLLTGVFVLVWWRGRRSVPSR
jgi:hypothetical protein